MTHEKLSFFSGGNLLRITSLNFIASHVVKIQVVTIRVLKMLKITVANLHIFKHILLWTNKVSSSSFTRENFSKQQKVLNAEVMVSNFIVLHNLSLSVADHLSQLFKKFFPDSQIASSYAYSRNKIFCIISKAFQPYYHKQIIDYCKNHQFTVGHDGSNNTGVQKMNPIAVRIFDINCLKTVSEHFYSI